MVQERCSDPNQLLFIEASCQVVAEQVCWDSAKVQLNSGILERRYQNWDRALMHFEHARAVEPGYCEPDYWIGITLLAQQANTSRAILVRTLLTADACMQEQSRLFDTANVTMLVSTLDPWALLVHDDPRDKNSACKQ